MSKAAARYVLIAILLMLLVNYPLLSAANKLVFIGNVPLLYLYIGTVWVLAIALLAITTRQHIRESDE